MPELPLDDYQRHAIAGHLDCVRVAQLMLVPTSAQSPLGRPGRYADLGEKVRARWDRRVRVSRSRIRRSAVSETGDVEQGRVVSADRVHALLSLR